MALPKEPRQKMINMMYLVLTALLALNVSAEILNAFKTVNASIIESNLNIDEKNKITYEQFDVQMKTDAAKVAPLKEKAEQVKQIAAAMTQYLEDLKKEVKEGAGLEMVDGEESFKEDNLEAATHIMENKKKGPELYAKLNEFSTNLSSFIDEKDKALTKIPLDLKMPKTQAKGNKDWASAYFRMTPAIAAVTILSKFQNDVKNSESTVVDYIYKKIDAQDFVLDKFEPFVSSNSSYLMQGQKYEATVGIGAFSSAAQPIIKVNGRELPVKDGVAKIEEMASSLGARSMNVEITLKKQDGTTETFTKKVEYTVGASSVAVSADKMNVLYIGVDNPISVSAGGVGGEKVNVSFSGTGAVQKAGSGKYVIKPGGSPGEHNINVTADGKTTPFRFRVKYLPDPVALIGTSKGGAMPAATFRAQGGVRAVLEGSDFEAYFNVISFTVGASGIGDDYLQVPNNGPAFGGQAAALISRAKPGSIVYIDDIKVEGPDGRSRKLPPIAFSLR